MTEDWEHPITYNLSLPEVMRKATTQTPVFCERPFGESSSLGLYPSDVELIIQEDRTDASINIENNCLEIQ